MMSHKITEKQQELIKSIKFIVTCWERTNDITSSTHYGDINEEFNKYGEEEDEMIPVIAEIMQDLYEIVRDYK